MCILMVVFDSTYRDIQNMVPSLNLPWNNNEPYPDHTWISRTFKKIPLQYLEETLTRSAYLCLNESGWKKGILASDSTGVETDRYEYQVRPVKSKKKFEGIIGAEETEHHQLYCRFRLKNNQKRFGLIKALAWNLEVLNRLQCANKLGINVTQYAIPN